jgi:hypothetical protein
MLLNSLAKSEESEKEPAGGGLWMYFAILCLTCIISRRQTLG